MNIIIEGMDNCGKSTVVDKLRVDFPYSFVMHAVKPPSNVNQYLWELMYYPDIADLSTKSSLHAIHDRFHLGVYVYGIQYRKYSLPDVAELFKQVEEKLTYDDTYLIVLTDNGESIMSRDDGLSFESVAIEYDNTKQKFIEAYHLSRLNKVHLDISDIGGFNNLYPKIKEFILNGNK